LNEWDEQEQDYRDYCYQAVAVASKLHFYSPSGEKCRPAVLGNFNLAKWYYFAASVGYAPRRVANEPKNDATAIGKRGTLLAFIQG
jgi:hypothetical protein